MGGIKIFMDRDKGFLKMNLKTDYLYGEDEYLFGKWFDRLFPQDGKVISENWYLDEVAEDVDYMQKHWSEIPKLRDRKKSSYDLDRFVKNLIDYAYNMEIKNKGDLQQIIEKNGINKDKFPKAWRFIREYRINEGMSEYEVEYEMFKLAWRRWKDYRYEQMKKMLMQRSGCERNESGIGVISKKGQMELYQEFVKYNQENEKLYKVLEKCGIAYRYDGDGNLYIGKAGMREVDIWMYLEELKAGTGN